MNLSYEVYRLSDISRKMDVMHIHPLDVLVVGATGSGKSTTLNTFFQREVAKVGDGVDPETMQVASYRFNQLCRLWDSPGFGDGTEQDKRHAQTVAEVLRRAYRMDNEPFGLIDLVLVIVDGGSRDLGTTYRLLENVILPNIQPDRVLVAINQADMAMKGQHWDRLAHRPDWGLLQFLREKEVSIQRRIRESTGMTIPRPVTYSALENYNITGLYDLIIDHIPTERRPIDLW